MNSQWNLKSTFIATIHFCIGFKAIDQLNN